MCAAAAARSEVDGQSTLLGFVGTPWTLAAYSMEGKADRDCKQTKVCVHTVIALGIEQSTEA
jgi:uroporphyrinogen-III decarboxylase